MMDTMAMVAGKSQKSINLQASKLIGTFGEQERQDILKKAGIRPVIEAERMVAMKCQLGLPWNKMRGVSL